MNKSKENCSPTKKIFVLGMISGNEEEQVQIDKSEMEKNESENKRQCHLH